MWLLLAACTPPAPPSLALPALPPAEHAETVNVDRFLSPTTLGAKDALLCPWFRGETVPDASLARWAKEARLAWLVLEAGDAGVTLAGSPDVAARAEEARAATATLSERCGAERAVEVLVTAGPTARYGALFEAVGVVGGAGLEAWLAVADASPTAFAAGETRPGQTFVALDAGGAGQVYVDGRAVGVTGARSGDAAAGGDAGAGVGAAGAGAAGVGGDAAAGLDAGAGAGGVDAAAGAASGAWRATLGAVPAAERTTCATVAAPEGAPWRVVVDGVDGVRGAGVARVTLGMGMPGGAMGGGAASGGGDATGAAASGGDGVAGGAASGGDDAAGGAVVPLHGAIAAVPLSEGCDAAEAGCPCVPGVATP